MHVSLYSVLSAGCAWMFAHYSTEYFVCIPARLANGASPQTAEYPIAGLQVLLFSVSGVSSAERPHPLSEGDIAACLEIINPRVSGVL